MLRFLCRDLLEGLHKVGYRTNFGDDDSGFIYLALKRGGGYYLGTILGLTCAPRCSIC